MLTRNRTFLLLALGLAVAAVIFKVPLASSQGLTIVAAEVAGDLPVNAPQSHLWQQATAVQVPLSAQMIARPIQPQTATKTVTARGLHNGQELALLLEWADPTADKSTLCVDEFRDGVAAQSPLAEGQPYFCMGQQDGDVNIWHWQADWQAAIDMRQDLRDVVPDMYVDQDPFTESGGDGLATAAAALHQAGPTVYAALGWPGPPAWAGPAFLAREVLAIAGAGALWWAYGRRAGWRTGLTLFLPWWLSAAALRLAGVAVLRNLRTGEPAVAVLLLAAAGYAAQSSSQLFCGLIAIWLLISTFLEAASFQESAVTTRLS